MCKNDSNDIFFPILSNISNDYYIFSDSFNGAFIVIYGV